MGKPYVFDTNGPNTLDCSGRRQWAKGQGFDVALHRLSAQRVPPCTVTALQAGDLVFFKIDPGHMGGCTSVVA